MSILPLPSPLQQLGGRRFSFYPPIRNLGPNEWLYRSATGSECVVANAKSGEEVWIPRLFLGEVSRIDEPIMLVRLNRELEWKSGAIVPRLRHVIELPVAANDNRPAPSSPAHLAPVVSIRLEPKTEVRAWKWIGVAVVLGAVACTIGMDIAYQSQFRQRTDLFRGYRPWLQLSANDDFAGDRVFRLLAYNGRRYSVILAGPKRETARYIGTLDPHGRVLDAARYRDGSTADALLHSLRHLLPGPGLLRSLPAF